MVVPLYERDDGLLWNGGNTTPNYTLGLKFTQSLLQ
jgi:hypothetical protein